MISVAFEQQEGVGEMVGMETTTDYSSIASWHPEEVAHEGEFKVSLKAVSRRVSDLAAESSATTSRAVDKFFDDDE